MSVPAAYLGIILIWSTTPLAIQWSTQGSGFAFAVFARMLVGLTPLRLVGMALGLAGLAAIFGHGEGAGDAQAGVGLAAVLLAVFFYSSSLVWLKRIDDDSHALATTVGTLAVSLLLGQTPSTARRSARVSGSAQPSSPPA